MTEHLWLNGRTVPADQPLTGGRSAAAWIGSFGIYETIRIPGGRPVRFAEHIARLQAGARQLGLTAPDSSTISAAAEELLRLNGLTDARLRINVLRGPAGNTDVLISATSPAPLPASQSLHTVAWRRNESSPLAGLKYTACPENQIAQEAARAAGADEALFLNTRGEVCEGAYSNFFAVIGGVVTTAPLSCGCLPGVTRAAVLGLCRHRGIPAQERPLLPEELHSPQCSELFLTSSLRGVMPVHSLDGTPIHAPGPVTSAIRHAMAAD